MESVTRREATARNLEDLRYNVYCGIWLYKEKFCKHIMNYYDGEIAIFIHRPDEHHRVLTHVYIDKEDHVSIEENGDDYFVSEKTLDEIIDRLVSGEVYQNGKYSKRTGYLLAPLKRKAPKPFDFELLPF